MTNVIKGIFPDKAAKSSPKEDKRVPSYVLHISLIFSEPLIWRRIQVPGSYTLSQLHDVIQSTMGWSDSHVHQFLVGKISYEPTIKLNKPRESKLYDESKYRLHALEEGMRFMFSYIYDAGEGWEHVIQLEEIVTPAREVIKPLLLAGEGCCPPEEVGDIHEYQQLLSAFEDPSSKDHGALFELSGRPDFNPAEFDLEAVKKKLARL